MNIDITIGRIAVNSRVCIDGQDVSACVRGVEVRAVVGEQTKVTLLLSADLTLQGEAGEVLRSLPAAEDSSTGLMLATLKTTAGNIRSLGPAGAVGESYREWLKVVEDAIAAAEKP